MKLKLKEDIHLTESEIADSMLIITQMNTVNQYMNIAEQKVLIENEIVLKEYLLGVSSVWIQVKMNEAKWRKTLSEKYDLPYDFIFRAGDILVKEES